MKRTYSSLLVRRHGVQCRPDGMDGRVISSVTQTSEGDSKMKRTYFGLLGAFVGFAAFLFGPFPALAQVAPNLKSAAPYAVLGTNAIPIIGTVTCTDTGPGIGITGQVGTTFAGGITNTGPCTITGPIVAPVGGAVVADFNAAFASIDGLNPVCTAVIPIVTTTLAPGVYCSAAGTTIGAGVTLTLNGNASDVWVFRVGTGGPGALTLTGGQVKMGGTAQACNVYWKTSAGMTVTDSASFVGTVLSGAAATMTRTSWTGRVMATTDVTLTDPEPMTFAGCAAPASLTLRKTWAVNSIAGNTVTVTSAGFVNNASSGLSTATSAGNTTTGVSVAVSAGETGTISEAFGVGTAANYTATLACTGNANALVANSLTVNAADVAIVCTETNALNAGVCPVISLSPVAGVLSPGTVGTFYSRQISASDSLESSFTYTVASGALPNGLTLNATTGVISGTPTTPGSFAFTITATDTSNGCSSAGVAYSIVIAAAAVPVAAVGGPTLDFVGLAILILLLTGMGVLLVNRFTL
jgi:Ice-binding-like/Putative Ig domain